MMTSVSTLSGYLKTEPFAFMAVTLLSSDRAGVGDAARQSAGSSGGGRGEVYLAVHMAHAAHEVAVGGGYAALTLGQDAHVAAQARTAGGGRDDAACINERRGPATEDALFVNIHGGGDDDAAHTFGNVLALEDVISGLHILQTAVGAAADDHLIDLDVLALAGNVGILGQVGVADRRLQRVEVDLNGLLVLGIGVCLIEDRLPLAAALEVSLGHLVHGEDAVLGTGLNGHVADAQAVVHGQGGHTRAGELHGLVQGTVHTDHADDVEDEVLAADAGAELALEDELDGGGHLEPCHAGGHTGGHIGGAHTGGERTQCTVGAGVAVGADDAVTRRHDAFFRAGGRAPRPSGPHRRN